MSVPASTAVLEFVQTSADGDFGLRCLDNSTVTITGQPRTAGKNIVQCKLTADVTSTNLIATNTNTNMTLTTSIALEASGNSLMAMGVTDNTTNATHSYAIAATSVSNTTQVASVWIARGSGLNNRYVRMTMGNAAVQSSVTNGFYSDLDLQAGTAGTVTVVGNGTATSVYIEAVGGGFVVRMIGKVSSGAATSTLLLNACSGAGTLSYAGNTTQCFIVDRPSIITASSLGDTTFNVNADTGWLSGDAVCVASTTRAFGDCSIFPLKGDAGASSFTSAIYPFAMPNISANSGTHHGTAPYQAEIGLLTRNVKIRSVGTALSAYVYCSGRSSVTASWAEFYYLGQNTIGKRGIEIDGAASSFPKSFSYCSIHDTKRAGFWCVASTSLAVTLSNTIVWNGTNDHVVSISATVTNNDWVFDSNLVMRPNISGFTINDMGGTFTNNTVVGCNSNGMTWSEGGAVAMGTFNGNTVHSCQAGLSFGCNVVGVKVIDGYKAWRNFLGYGILVTSEGADVTFTNLTLFGNAQINLSMTGGGNLTIDGGTIAGETGFTTPVGIGLSSTQTNINLNFSNVDMSGVGGNFLPHTTNDVLQNNRQTTIGVMNNCALGSPAPFVKSVWTNKSYISHQKYNRTAGDHRTDMTNGQVKTDTAIYNLASPSMRMTPTSATVKLESATKGRGIQVAVNSGDTVTASIWVRKNTFYNGVQPRLIVRSNSAIGITSDTVLASCTDVVGGSLPVWDSATTASVNLSGGDLVATSTGTTSTNQGAHVASALGKTTGKYYFEIVCTDLITGAQVGMGVGTTTSTYAGMSGSGTLGAHMIANGNIYGNGTGSGYSLNPRSDGNVIGIAVDLDSRLAWFRVGAGGNWNNAGAYSPVTGVGGVTLPATGAMVPFVTFGGAAGVANVIFTANFGATAFTGGVPSGYFSGWGPFAGSVATDTWVTISGTTVAATDDGAMEFIVDCDGTAGYINVDDWSFTAAASSYLSPGLVTDTDAFAVPAISSAFTPASLTGLIGWWDTSVTASITLSGSNITALADQSGVSNTLTPADGNVTYEATGFNSSYPTLRVNNGAAGVLAKSAFPMGNGNTLTVFYVGTAAEGASSAAGRTFSYLKPSYPYDYDNVGSWTISNSTTNNSSFMTRGSGMSAGVSGLTGYPAPHRFIWTINSSGVMRIYVDGVETVGSTSPGNFVTGGTFVVGRTAGATADYWAGKISEFGVATGYSDATTVAQLDAYLVNKWISPAAANFLARTTGLDTTHTNAYTALINGLVTDGIWTKLDVLHIYATQNSTTAQLNLISTSYPATLNGSPTFTADSGYQGVGSSSTVYISTNFAPGLASSPKFVQNSAHISIWNATDTGTSPQTSMGYRQTAASFTQLCGRFADGNAYFAVNSTGSYLTATSASPQGHWIANRSGASDIQGYKNGSSFASSAAISSTTVTNGNYVTLGQSLDGVVTGSNVLMSAASIGASLTSTEALALYNRLYAYMIAISGAGAEATAFLLRTTGLNLAHMVAYSNLINGLVADGIWSKLDVLHVYATQDSTTAQLNLISSSYSAAITGSPTFTADSGYLGTSGGSNFINTQFDPSTAPSPKFVRDSSHMSLWNLTNTTAGDYAMGKLGSTNAGIIPYYGGTAYHYMNGPQDGGGSVADPRGHFIGNRSTSGLVQSYKNGVSCASSSNTSSALVVGNIHTLGYKNGSNTHTGLGWQFAMASIGSSLTSGEATAFYNRLRTYMTAVGVP